MERAAARVGWSDLDQEERAQIDELALFDCAGKFWVQPLQMGTSSLSPGPDRLGCLIALIFQRISICLDPSTPRDGPDHGSCAPWTAVVPAPGLDPCFPTYSCSWIYGAPVKIQKLSQTPRLFLSV